MLISPGLVGKIAVIGRRATMQIPPDWYLNFSLPAQSQYKLYSIGVY